ncbi:MAG: acyl carrier protein [Caldilinea sp.]
MQENRMDEIVEQLRTIIAEQLDANLRREEITLDVPLLEEGLGLDSIMVVALITLVEETFHFEFAEDELELGVMANLRTLAAFVAAKQAQNQAEPV